MLAFGSTASLPSLLLLLVALFGSLAIAVPNIFHNSPDREPPFPDFEKIQEEALKNNGEPFLQSLCWNHQKCMGTVSHSLWVKILKFEQNELVPMERFQSAVEKLGNSISDHTKSMLSPELIIEKFKMFKPLDGRINYARFQDQLFNLKLSYDEGNVALKKFETDVPALTKFIFGLVGTLVKPLAKKLKSPHLGIKKILDKVMETAEEDAQFYETGLRFDDKDIPNGLHGFHKGKDLQTKRGSLEKRSFSSNAAVAIFPLVKIGFVLLIFSGGLAFVGEPGALFVAVGGLGLWAIAAILGVLALIFSKPSLD